MFNGADVFWLRNSGWLGCGVIAAQRAAMTPHPRRLRPRWPFLIADPPPSGGGTKIHPAARENFRPRGAGNSPPGVRKTPPGAPESRKKKVLEFRPRLYLKNNWWDEKTDRQAPTRVCSLFGFPPSGFLVFPRPECWKSVPRRDGNPPLGPGPVFRPGLIIPSQGECILSGPAFS